MSVKREVPYTAVFRDPLNIRAMEVFRVLDALSCYLSLILKNSDTKEDTKNIVDPWGGGGGAFAPPPPPPPLNPPLRGKTDYDFSNLFLYNER